MATKKSTPSGARAKAPTSAKGPARATPAASERAAAPPAPPDVLTSVVGEEEGLVTLVIPREPGAGHQRGGRLRLWPHGNEQRGGLLADLDGALAHAHRTILAPLLEQVPGAEWSDTVVSSRGVTVSFGVPTVEAQRALLEAAVKLPVGPWKLYNTERDEGHEARVSNLRDYLVVVPAPPTRADLAQARRLEEALTRSEPPGSFRKQAGLDAGEPRADRVVKALRWLSAALEAIDEPVAEALGVAGARVQVSINQHPRYRTFELFWETRKQPRAAFLAAPLSVASEAVLARFLDLPQPAVRLVAGALWEAGVTALDDAPRISIACES